MFPPVNHFDMADAVLLSMIPGMDAITTAGIIPFRLVEGKPVFLILRAYNYWDFPKGTVEDGEEPFDAAVRELGEETFLKPVAFPCGQEYYQTERYAGRKVARYYIAEVAGEVKLSREHHEFRWVTADEAQKLFVPRVKKVLNWGEGLLKNK